MDLLTKVRPISPSDIIPYPFLEALTALSKEYGFWIRGGELSRIESAPDRSYWCGGYNDRALRLDDEIEVSGTH